MDKVTADVTVEKLVTAALHAKPEEVMINTPRAKSSATPAEGYSATSSPNSWEMATEKRDMETLLTEEEKQQLGALLRDRKMAHQIPVDATWRQPSRARWWMERTNEEAELNSLVELFVQAFEQIDLLVPEEFYEFVSAFVQKSSNASADLLVQEPNEAHEELCGETSHNECGFQGDANGGLDDLFFDVGGLGCKL